MSGKSNIFEVFLDAPQIIADKSSNELPPTINGALKWSKNLSKVIY